MADRIVLLGWGGEAVELFYPGDAAAMVDTGTCRVSMTLWSGPLADATVLQFTPDHLRKLGGENEAGYAKAMKIIHELVRADVRRDLTLETPIPVGGKP